MQLARILGWTTAVTLLLAALAGAVVAQSGGGWFAYGQLIAASQPGTPVVLVNGQALSNADLTLAVARAVHVHRRGPESPALRDAVLKELVREEVAYQAAVEAGFGVSAVEASANLKDQLTRGADTAEIRDLLAGAGRSANAYATWAPAVSDQQRALSIGRYRYSTIEPTLRSDPTGRQGGTAWEAHLDQLVAKAKVVTP